MSALRIVALLLLVPSLAWAVGEQNGRIAGTITEAQTGAPVPGATVTITGSALIGGPKTVSSGDDGRYEIVEVPPGKYDVQIAYAGVKPIKRRVVVRQGEAVPLDVAWSPELTQTEVTVVVEERHMTRPDSTQTGTVLSADSESKVASGRRYQDVVQHVAGVAPAQGNSGNPSVKGGSFTQNRYLVDGLDITDPVSGTFSANINFDSLASFDVITGGMEAQYNALGGIINLITQSGSDEWHVDSSIYVNNSKFTATSQYGAQVYDGLRPYSPIPAAQDQSYQANLNFGGPLLKHRLWFNLSAEYKYQETNTPAGPPLNVQAPPFKRNQFLGRLKLTWAPNDKHRLTISASADPAFLSNIDSLPGAGGCPGGNCSNFQLPNAKQYQRQGGLFAIVQWDWFIKENVNFNLQTGTQFQTLDNGPEGYFTKPDFTGAERGFSSLTQHYDFNQPRHTNVSDGTGWYNGTALGFDRRYMFQFDPSISLRGRAAGYHDAKIGIQNRYTRWTFDQKTPGDATYLDNGGGPLEDGVCNETTGRGCFLKTIAPPFHQEAWGWTTGLFAQDRWKPVKRLTIVPGLRFDWGIVKNGVGETVSSLWGFGPRLGAIVDITGDQKTIFSAFYGRSNEVMSLTPATVANPSSYSPTNQWNQNTKQFDQFFSATGGANGYRTDRSAKTPHTDEVDVSLRREIFHDSVAGVAYTYKRISNIWDAVEINQIWDPSGYRVLGYVDPSHPQQIFKVTTPDYNWREYQGIDFTVESRPTTNWYVYVGYTLSWLYGPGAEELGFLTNLGLQGSQGYNPRLAPLYNGFLPDDHRHLLKLNASYTYKGLSIGGFLQYISGSPETKRFFQYKPDGDFLNPRSPIGTEPGVKNDPRSFAEFRIPDLVQLDVRVQYDLNAILKQHIIVIADLFNVFNLQTPAGLNYRDQPALFGTVTSRQAPFRFQLALRYLY